MRKTITIDYDEYLFDIERLKSETSREILGALLEARLYCIDGEQSKAIEFLTERFSDKRETTDGFLNNCFAIIGIFGEDVDSYLESGE